MAYPFWVQSAVTVAPSDGVQQHYVGFVVTVAGLVSVEPWATPGVNVLIPCAVGIPIWLEVSKIRAAGTTATGIIGFA